MLLHEAKAILKQNGYIVEAYDAVTDRKQVKDKRNGSSYFTNIHKRVAAALEEEGYQTTIGEAPENYYYKKIVFDKLPFKVKIYLEPTKSGYVNGKTSTKFDGTEDGPESHRYSDYVEMENVVKVEIFTKEGKEITYKKFDVRNTPSIVKWIVSNIEKTKNEVPSTNISVPEQIKEYLLAWDYEEEDIDNALSLYKNKIKQMIEDGEEIEVIAGILADWKPLSKN